MELKLLRSTDSFHRDLRTFLFNSVITGTRIRIDSVMRPRSSSRGRNTSASVTVTVYRPDGFVDEKLAVGVLEQPVDRLDLGDELFGRDVLQPDAALQQFGRHAQTVFAVEVEPLQQSTEYFQLALDVETVVRQDAVQALGRQIHKVLRVRHLHTSRRILK